MTRLVQLLIGLCLGVLRTAAQMPIDWDDHSYKPIVLKGTSSKHVVVADAGQNTAIILDADALRDSCKALIRKGWDAEEYQLLLCAMDSLGLAADTNHISLTRTQAAYLISDFLYPGSCKVIDRTTHKPYSKVSYRIERYGMYADCVYYLPNGEPFLAFGVASGILDGEHYFSDPEELGRQYDLLIRAKP